MQSKKEREMWTRRREDRSIRDLEIFLSYHELTREGGMPLGIIDYLCDKYEVVRNTVYNIRKRTPSKLDEMAVRHPKYAQRIAAYKSKKV